MVAHTKLSNMKELGDSVSSAAKLKKDTENFKEEQRYCAYDELLQGINLFLNKSISHKYI